MLAGALALALVVGGGTYLLTRPDGSSHTPVASSTSGTPAPSASSASPSSSSAPSSPSSPSSPANPSADPGLGDDLALAFVTPAQVKQTFGAFGTLSSTPDTQRAGGAQVAVTPSQCGSIVNGLDAGEEQTYLLRIYRVQDPAVGGIAGQYVVAQELLVFPDAAAAASAAAARVALESGCRHLDNRDATNPNATSDLAQVSGLVAPELDAAFALRTTADPSTRNGYDLVLHYGQVLSVVNLTVRDAHGHITPEQAEAIAVGAGASLRSAHS